MLAWIRTAAPVHYPEFSEEAFHRNLVVGADGLLRSRHTAETFLALNRAVEEQEMPGLEIYGQIRCPVMLVMATKGMFNREAVERVLQRNPNLRVEWLDCGHIVQQERPEELAALITDFALSLDHEHEKR